MRIAIVEDEKECTAILEQHLQRFQKENNIEIQHRSYTNGMDFLAAYQPVWDLLLLDIEMPMMDGLMLAHKIREMDTDVLIIFVTKMAQYAMAGYEVSALDYVLKPVNYYAFSMKLRKVQNLLQTKQQHFLVVQGNGFVRKMEVGMIRYIEVLGHTLTYHTPQGMISSIGKRHSCRHCLHIGEDKQMAYDITKIFTLGSLQCSLITALLYMIPLKKREKFLLRFLGCATL